MPAHRTCRKCLKGDPCRESNRAYGHSLAFLRAMLMRPHSGVSELKKGRLLYARPMTNSAMYTPANALVARRAAAAARHGGCTARGRSDAAKPGDDGSAVTMVAPCRRTARRRA
eukprot:6178396-Pleurochrysis_carterae.AAC.1